MGAFIFMGKIEGFLYEAITSRLTMKLDQIV